MKFFSILILLGLIFALPTSTYAGRAEGGDISFSVQPRTFNATDNQSVALTFNVALTIYGPEFRNYCGINVERATWIVYPLYGESQLAQIVTQTVNIDNTRPSYQQDHSDQKSINVGSGNTWSYIAYLHCGGGSAQKKIAESRVVTVQRISGGGGGGGTGGCGTSGQPACRPGASQSFSFEILNPLKGGASDFSSLVKIIAQWIFNLAIPIAVAMIVYAGILFLTAAGEPAKVTKARDVLKWAVIGLAIILIGSGFVTLIKSILDLGGTGST